MVLINPTYLNLSAAPDWQSQRFPFIGVRHFWKVLHQGGFISKKLLDKIYRNNWDKVVLDEIISEFEEARVYLTNMVKCTAGNPDYPKKELIDYHLNFLQKEIEILQPKRIIGFGLLPFRKLTGQVIKLGDVYSQLKTGPVVSFPLSLPVGSEVEVLPCYFPVGQGSPKRAAEMLAWYKEKLI